MTTFTIERQYLLPIYQHITIEAPDVETAMREAMDESIHGWEGSKEALDSCTSHCITGAWESDDAYTGKALDVPEEFGDKSQDLAGHIDADELAFIRRAIEYLPYDASEMAMRDKLIEKFK